jgi:hypothetical protein
MLVTAQQQNNTTQLLVQQQNATQLLARPITRNLGYCSGEVKDLSTSRSGKAEYRSRLDNEKRAEEFRIKNGIRTNNPATAENMLAIEKNRRGSKIFKRKIRTAQEGMRLASTIKKIKKAIKINDDTVITGIIENPSKRKEYYTRLDSGTQNNLEKILDSHDRKGESIKVARLSTNPYSKFSTAKKNMQIEERYSRYKNNVENSTYSSTWTGHTNPTERKVRSSGSLKIKISNPRPVSNPKHVSNQYLIEEAEQDDGDGEQDDEGDSGEEDDGFVTDTPEDSATTESEVDTSEVSEYEYGN